MTPNPARKGRVLYTGELDMREILWALIAAPILYIILWLLLAMF
jgi:hypothetical protein